MAIASDPALLGQNFLDQLPPIAADTANDLAKLTYPLADRLALHDQIQDRELVPNKALMEISFPVLSLSDALDKFFARRPGNLMRWAVGDYETAIVRNLALALSAGTIRVSASSRQLEVILMSKGGPGAVIDLSCDCLRGRGECQMIINPSGQNITCSGSCKECTIQVVITGSSLGYSSLSLDPAGSPPRFSFVAPESLEGSRGGRFASRRHAVLPKRVISLPVTPYTTSVDVNQGIDVKDRGRVPAELVVKFKAVTGH